MEKKVLSQEEIETIKKLKDQIQNFVQFLGELELQMIDLQIKKDNIISEFKQLQIQEQVLIKQLEEKYGKGTVLLDTGEFLAK